jgi:hypothetical protein
LNDSRDWVLLSGLFLSPPDIETLSCGPELTGPGPSSKEKAARQKPPKQ